MSKLIAQLEFWLILFALAAIPNWSWPVWGSAEESRMIAIAFVAVVLLFLETIGVILRQSDRISFGFFKSPLNWILAVPFLLVILNSFQDLNVYQFLGFGVPWHTAVLPVFLLLAWHFLLRRFFVGDDKTALLKFAFAWFVVFTLIALARWSLASQDAGLGTGAGLGSWFALGSILALVLAVLRVPLSAYSLSPPLTKGGTKGGLRLGRAVYFPLIVLIAAAGLFIRFEIRVARAAVAAARNDFSSARKFNPYHPLYSISWVEQEIANLEKMDLTADVAAAKEKVGEIVKGLEALSSSRPFSLLLRIAQAWERLGKFAEGANEKAVTVYDAIIAAQGDNPDSSLIIKKVLLLEKAGRTNEAIEWLESKSGTEPPLPPLGKGGIKGGSPEIQYHLGRLLYNSGKAEEAAAIWLAILEYDPDYADVNYSLGAYFARQGKVAEALKYFEKVLQLAPDTVEVKKKIDELKRKR